MTSVTIQTVIQTLHDLNAIHETLLELGEQKREVLVANQVNELTRITNEESKLMKQVSECEQRWLAGVARFLNERGLERDPSITMSELIKLVTIEDDKQALQGAQQQLLATMDKLNDVNALNQQLIEQSLSFIDYTLDLLTEDTSELLGYSNPSDKPKTARNNTIFDTKA